MKMRIEIQLLTCSDAEQFIEFISDTPDTAFQVIIGTSESTISWDLEGEFCKHFLLKWRGKEMKAWIVRKTLSGSSLLFFWCAEVRNAEWWASFPDGVCPNDGLRSYRIHEGQFDTIAHLESNALRLTGSEKYIRLTELTINQ